MESKIDKTSWWDKKYASPVMQKPAETTYSKNKEADIDGRRTDGRSDGWMELQIPARDKRDDSFADKTGAKLLSSISAVVVRSLALSSLALW